MADQQRWFKLWCSASEDDELQRRPGALRWAWAALGCYTKVHGTHGVVRISASNGVLAGAMGVPVSELLDTLLQLPSIALGTAPVRWQHGHHKRPVCDGEFMWGSYPLIMGCSLTLKEWCTRHGEIIVTWKNWNKYQMDSTQAQRGAASRSKKRREEKRGEETLLRASVRVTDALETAERAKLSQWLAEHPHVAHTPAFERRWLERARLAALPPHPTPPRWVHHRPCECLPDAPDPRCLALSNGAPQSVDPTGADHASHDRLS